MRGLTGQLGSKAAIGMTLRTTGGVGVGFCFYKICWEDGITCLEGYFASLNPVVLVLIFVAGTYICFRVSKKTIKSYA